MPPNKDDKKKMKKKDDDKTTKGDEKKVDEKPKEEDNSKNKQRHKSGGFGGSSSNNNSNSTPPPQEQVGGLFVLLLLLLGVRTIQDTDEKAGREINWHDFRNYMLQQDAVESFVVVNKKMARVTLKEGAVGLPHHNSNSYEGGSMMTSDAVTPVSEDWNDGTQMEWGNKSAATVEGASLGGSTPKSKNNVYHFYIGSIESLEEKLTKAQQEMGIAPRDYLPVQYVTETNWVVEAIKVSPALVMVGLTVWMLRGGGAGAAGRGGGMFQVGKSTAKKINKEEVTTTFADVAGCHEAKKEIMEFVDFLQDSSRFTKLGAKIPKGALLCGPPGTGKTLLAKAVAGQANVPFYSISGSDFLEMFVGVGPSRVRDLFKEARANAPCIIFIDEIDAVGRQRGRGGMGGGNDERENTLNQLLVEMDGFSPTTGVVVLAGTNRADILDQALTRPGRFDRQIQVDRPDLQGRKEIFEVHLKGIKLADDIGEIAGRLAGLTPGFAGADIANICNEAAIVGARRKADSVTLEDFEKATDRIIGGLESNKIMSEEERSIVAYHEAGHAVAGWFLEHADPLLKVTIIPRTSGALGFAQYLPKEVFLRSQDQIMDIVCMALAGRAAEEVFFGGVTTGASDDLRRVTGLVYSTIKNYGMNSRVGQLAFPNDDGGMPGDKPYSDATAEAMDEEARAIVDDAYKRTVALIRERKDDVEAVAKMLLEKETITHDMVYDLVGPRPFDGDEQYNQYVSSRFVADKEDDAKEDAEESKVEEEKTDDGNLTPGLA
jgi:AFG3 family protein